MYGTSVHIIRPFSAIHSDFFTLPKFGRVSGSTMFEPDHASKWSDPDPWNGNVAAVFHAHRCSRLTCQNGGDQSGLVTLTFDLESGVRVTCDVGYLCANCGLPRPFCSRLRPDVRDRQTSDSQTDVRQTDVREHRGLLPRLLGMGHNKLGLIKYSGILR